ncbi:M14 metallopeptidase family protein [Longimicrobium sp.]|uniref:M14 family metallopeptidase n=1 Tax=Longimicrobium sp. TaxID=2029185 RepID=UPI002E31CE87|nr:M14 metallopeptidase family protein [Longimicrobium sp.]HEX6038517.1 M14 metallopeptidase family protein [Longimicrobium sp.]
MRRAPALALALGLLAHAAPAAAQQRLTTPEQQFGHAIGADYVLPNYQQLLAYWQKLDGESDRMKLVDIGRTAEGRQQVMAIVTSPANHRTLDRWRETSRTLAMGQVDSATAARLAAEGKAVVWIDGGLHATEVLGAQQLMETLWQLVSRDDPETMRILDDVVILFVHANPDGMELVSNWYMRAPNPQARSMAYLPRLYQKYIGHDNNRDFYASTQPETENMNRVMYREWYPQIVYNHHQTGPTGTVMFAPPFRDPFNYVYDPLIVSGIDMVGSAMMTRFLAENKPGVTVRKGSNYSTWWNGGLRTTAYFHNMVGLLTETIGNPTPFDIPFVPNRQVPSGDLPAPVPPQTWHFRQSIDYSVTANYAVLDYAQRYRQTLLMNFWRMGRNSIERGRRDNWTTSPRHVDSVRAVISAERQGQRSEQNALMSPGGQFGGAANPEQSARYLALLRRPEWRDARGYVIPSTQADFATATKFVNALLETGISVGRATRSFTVGGKTYPAGSYVVRADQPFRPHVLDMFEPQDHPNDFLYEGGPPIPPYDNAGWTLAYQMGVEFDRVLEGFDAPVETVDAWNLPAPRPQHAAQVRARGAGWTLSPRQNDAFTVVNRLLAQGAQVQRVTGGDNAGDFFIPASGGVTAERLIALADSLGVTVSPARGAPRQATPLRPLRIGLADRYGGLMPSGWTRWILEQFGFPYQVVFPQELDAGNLNAKYDVLVFVDGAIPERDPRAGAGGFMPNPDAIPAELRSQTGLISVERTVPQLRAFMENGGTVLTIGGSTVLARHLGLPIEDHLVEAGENGQARHLPREKYYIPGSLLRVSVDNDAPVAWGMGEQADVMFDDSPVFRLGPGAEAAGIKRVAWYDSPAPLRSGWAWGQQYLQNGAAVVSAPVGRGMLYLFGPEIAFRAQPHGTFRLLFNGLYESVREH